MTANIDDYRTGRHVVYNLHAYIVLVTKYRKGCITDRVRDNLIETTREVCERFETELIEAGGETDHLHLLISYPPKIALSTLIGAIKTNTSKRVREKNWPEIRKALWGRHFWTPSYFVTSTGGAPLQRVAEYLRNQRQPNKTGRPTGTR